MKNFCCIIVGVVFVCLLSVCSASCQNNGVSGHTTKRDSTANKTAYKMPAKERVAKNNTIVKDYNTGDRLNRKGRIKSVTTFLYKIPCLPGKEQREDSQYETLYDIKGNIVETVSMHTQSNSVVTYMYDVNNNDTATCIYSGNRLEHKYVAKYDYRGNEIEVDEFYEPGELFAKDVYKYDDRDNLIERSHYVEGSFSHRTAYKYDENGFLTTEEDIEAEGPSIRNIYKFDDKGNLLEITLYKTDGGYDAKYIHKYDGDGRRIETTGYNENGALVEKYTWKYDAMGNKTEDLLYNASGTLDSRSCYFEYQYDSIGNATRQTTLQIKGGKKTIVTVEGLTYTYY